MHFGLNALDIDFMAFAKMNSKGFVRTARKTNIRILEACLLTRIVSVSINFSFVISYPADFEHTTDQNVNTIFTIIIL